MHPLADRPRYTREQLATYVRKVNRDEAYTLDTLEAEIKADPLPALAGLQRKQVEWNPWGNLALHYSWHRTLSLDSEALYDKIVDRGLGGYCMENNAFFSAILRSLGYELYITGARVSNAVDGLDASDQDGFGGWYCPPRETVSRCALTNVQAQATRSAHCDRQWPEVPCTLG